MLTVCLVLLAGATFVLAQDFKLFPGAKKDDKASREASQSGPSKNSEVFTTTESFDKVFAFYKALYTQDTKMPAKGPMLPSGKQVQWGYFILDGARDARTSKFWMKVQRPFLGGDDGKDVRDVTFIQTFHTK
jgi:hypothetical protein